MIFADTPKGKKFRIRMKGDLDDDLIILKATPTSSKIIELYQMHNPKETFEYCGDIYKSNHIAGYIDFNKEFEIKDDEVFLFCLANEREEVNITERIRTHYKNEKLTINDKELLPALMPEYDSVPGYPLWFGEGDSPMVYRTDIKGDLYNYYNLFENTTVQIGIVVPFKGPTKIYMFDQNDELRFTFFHDFNKEVKKLRSKELLEGKLQDHPFAEVNNILNKDLHKQIQNNDTLNKLIIEHEKVMYTIELPYPAMYPNLLFGTAV